MGHPTSLEDEDGPMTVAPRILRRRSPLLAALLGAVLLLGSAAAAQAAPPDGVGKPDRGRDSYVALGDSFVEGYTVDMPPRPSGRSIR